MNNSGYKQVRHNKYYLRPLLSKLFPINARNITSDNFHPNQIQPSAIAVIPTTIPIMFNAFIIVKFTDA